MGAAKPNGSSKRNNQLIGIDLGTHSTKAVSLERRGEKLILHAFAQQDALAADTAVHPDKLGPQLTQICQSLGAKTRQVVFSLGVSDCILRHAELPGVSVDDMRAMLKFNAKNYLQQDLPGHVFDCHPLPGRPGAKADAPRAQRSKVIIGAARQELLGGIQNAAKAAGLTTEGIVPGLIGPANAFESAHAESYASGAIALVDVGFRNTSIGILLAGELVLSRVLAVGSDHFTTGVAEALGISYAEAEGIKVGLADEVQSTMVTILGPLGRELRASMDFFEHQHDATVSQVYLSGGSARSDYILQILQTELLVPCSNWNPAASMSLALDPARKDEFEHAAPQFAVAIGTVLAVI